MESLSQAELCALLFDSIDALLLEFMRAQDKISRLERACKEKTDTLRDLQLSHEKDFQTMADRLKAQEQNCEKEKRHLELQYSSLLAEARATAQEHQEAARKTLEKINALEKAQENLARENASLRHALESARKERLSLLAACGLLSGALCPLYGRLRAMSSQRDLLQNQVNTYQVVNQKIRVILDALPAEEGTDRDEARLRQRRGRALVYVFRRAVIAVLAANRLRVLARFSTSIFTWTSGVEGGSRIQVCVGECHGRHNESYYTDEDARCLETVEWLSSCNLLSAIISSLSEVQNIL
ncbi:CC171 protein, partial [Sclerurus mexicanus]|nr:CC171 protein [Sclerurus mexicanus]